MVTRHFKIAEAARMVGVSPSTLRLWEQQDLIQPIRTTAGQRLYDDGLIERLKLIAWLRSEKGLNPAAIRESIKPPRVNEDEQGGEAIDDHRVADVPIGMKVRHLRHLAGKTLADIAKATGVTTSLLSTFERTSQGISITTLHGISNVLGTTVADLSGQALSNESVSLVRDHHWSTLPTSASGVTISLLAEGKRQMECHRFELAPGASSEGAYKHEGEEFMFVLSGSLEIVLDGDQFYELHGGDSFYFESSRPHAWRNISEGKTVMIWVNTPATF